MGIKNFWSLQVDEAITAEKLKASLGKDYEVFFPINSQLKDIDLLIYNLKKRETKSIQVKGSRSYLNDGEQYSWHIIRKDSIFKPINKVDFFIFLWHVQKNKGPKREIMPAYLVIPIEKFKQKLKEKTMRKNKTYHFSFSTNLKDKATDFNNSKYKEVDFSEFLNNFELLKK